METPQVGYLSIAHDFGRLACRFLSPFYCLLGPLILIQLFFFPFSNHYKSRVLLELMFAYLSNFERYINQNALKKVFVVLDELFRYYYEVKR